MVARPKRRRTHRFSAQKGAQQRGAEGDGCLHLGLLGLLCFPLNGLLGAANPVLKNCNLGSILLAQCFNLAIALFSSHLLQSDTKISFQLVRLRELCQARAAKEFQRLVAVEIIHQGPLPSVITLRFAGCRRQGSVVRPRRMAPSPNLLRLIRGL